MNLMRRQGLTHAEHVPAMVIRPGELAPRESTLEIDVIAEDDVERTVAILASAFEAPRDLFDWFGRLISGRSRVHRGMWEGPGRGGA